MCLRGAVCNFIVQGVGGFLQFLQLYEGLLVSTVRLQKVVGVFVIGLQALNPKPWYN